QRYKSKIPIIFDGKRGDIGRTSEAYSREIFEFWGAHAATISPYMGEDSVKPFLREGKITYVLCKTSNAGSKDFQELKVGGTPLYERIAKKAHEWNCGLVVGATGDAAKTIKKIIKIAPNAPLLIPGVGTQGGDLEGVLSALKGKNFTLHRINASSSIAYAAEKTGGKPANAAVKEAEKMNKSIRKYLE
ncbi:orotidine-5'-phosphate decarboxylase, partial [Candidatus Micrarchaeota archaeon]|nr:orotidine-5'-phosphate decarboxylase [Candidatus Micrarchaeota archaeon]